MNVKSWGMVLFLVLVAIATGPNQIEAKGFRAAMKNLFGRLFGKKPQQQEEAEVPAEEKGEGTVTAYQGSVRHSGTAPNHTAMSYETRPSFNLLYGDLGRYGSEDVITELEAGFHNFAANLYQGQVMMRAALSRLATAVKRVVLPIAGDHATNLWYIRQRTVNLYFDSRALALRCLYIAYFPIPATSFRDTRDIAYRKRKLLHFLGTYYMLDARLTLLIRFMKGLLSTVAEVFMAQKGTKYNAMGQVIQTSGLYLVDGFTLLLETLAGLKEAVVSSLVFPHPRERVYRALHRTGLNSHHILNAAKSAIDTSVEFRRGQIGQIAGTEKHEDTSAF
ncbi:putative transmembrane protein [Toxoplasma gondii TgCatPRC2]|uniref:Putative transmembrane protein n=1 Tax=Toxoplasma gondii TgCatPRC2 TaxID=1130821 RepID=A0A151H048_TOXGO|nr:putative transmembrane protein [Toxoplasma gondii TgCatPRC2]